MDYSTPWPSEFSFKSYLSEHTALTGRTWLTKDMEKLLTTSKYGVLLTADIGVGKSAIMSHICCVSNSEAPGFKIRKNMAAFHMCRYDSVLTQKPDIFIKNLAASLTNLIPEYGNVLNNVDNKMALNYLLSHRCEEDPFGCFDSAIVHIFKQVQSMDKPYILLIDGMDECFPSDAEKPSIVSLLSRKITKLSPHLKLLVSSRNIPAILSEFMLLNHYHINEADYNNMNDIKLFIKTQLYDNNKMKYFAHRRAHMHHTDRDIEDNIFEMANGNFLYVVHVMENSRFNESVTLPKTLEHLYQTNFDRIFGKNELVFNKIRPLFEILVSASTPLTEDQLLNISGIPSADEEMARHLLKVDLRHFLRNVNGTVSFVHKAISDFLLNEYENKKYIISKRMGHERIAKFLLKANDQKKVLDLILHIAHSNNTVLRTLFIEKGRSIIRRENFTFSGRNETNILYNAVRYINSYNAITLLLKVIGCRKIDEISFRNVTASFVASAYGHAKTLRALYEVCGASLYFKKGGPPLVQSDRYTSDIVTFCKQTSFWGYSLLHISAQNGHHAVVNFLLENAPMLINETNSLNLYPLHIASEHGHTAIVRQLIWKGTKGIDNQALYYAAKNGHNDVVDILVYHGVVDYCLPCTGNCYWLHANQSRLQSYSSLTPFLFRNYTFQVI